MIRHDRKKSVEVCDLKNMKYLFVNAGDDKVDIPAFGDIHRFYEGSYSRRIDVFDFFHIDRNRRRHVVHYFIYIFFETKHFLDVELAG